MTYDARAFGARCSECPLGERGFLRDASRPFQPVPGEFQGGTVLAVAENPADEEIKQGAPLRGKSGVEWNEDLRAIGRSRPEVALTNVIECLRGTSNVRLGNGKIERIENLVANRYAGTVLSVSATGTLVERRVTGWYKSNTNGRRLLKLTTEGAKKNGKGFTGPVLTEDHPVLTQRGYIKAGGLMSSDLVATGDVELTEAGRSIVIGTILGDGCIPRDRRYLAVSHAEQYRDYAQYRTEALASIGAVCVHSKPTSQPFPRWDVRTEPTRWIASLRPHFYPDAGNGLARLVPEWLELDPLMLAVWYMDDGFLGERHNRNPYMSFNQSCVDNKGVSLLRRALSHMGVETRVHNGGRTIYLSPESARVTAGLIATYIPPSMQYKLPGDFRGRFNPSSYAPEPPKPCWAKPIVTEVEPHYRNEAVYCIDVEETHSFVTSDAVVHNCMPPGEASGGYSRMERSIKKENDRLAAEGSAHHWPHPATCCAPRLQATVAQYRNVIALGGTAAKALLSTSQGIHELRGGPVEVPTADPSYPRRVLPTLHPAYLLRATQWREIFQCDLAKAFRWFEGKRNWTEPYYEWMPTPQRLREWLRQPARFTVHDYETSSKDPLTAIVDCIGFARLVEPAAVWPCEKCSGTGKRIMVFSSTEGWIYAPAETMYQGPCACCNGAGKRLIEVHSVLVPVVSRQDRSRHFYPAGEEEEIKDVIREHMVDASSWKVGHNLLGYDIPVTQQWLGVTPWPVIDTLPMARARAPDLPKGLGIIGSIYSDVHAWKLDHDGKKIAYGAVSDRQLHYYCGPGDCAVNAKIYDPLVEIATKQGYFRPLREEIKPKGWPSHVPWTLQGVDQHRMSMCRHMHRAGLYVDQAKRFEHSTKLAADATKYFAEARAYAASIGLQGPVKTKARGPEPFNPGSDKQLAHLLYEVWGLLPTKFSDLTGAPSVDDEVIREIITSENLPKDRFTFLDAIRRGKRAKKAKATFVDPLECVSQWQPVHSPRGKLLNREPLCGSDGRIHPFVSAIITSVARLNSSAINEHNMPVKYRDQIAAQPIYGLDHPKYPGRVLIGGDVDQFHLRIIANRWRIGRLLEAFHNGIDPHSSLALDFFGAKFRHADGWGPDGMSLKRKPKKNTAADKMRNMAKILRYRGAYADTEEGLLQSVKKVEDPNTGDLPFSHMSLREVKKLYRIWMAAEPEWQAAWQWVLDQYQVNGGWLEECIMGRRSGGLENGKKQAVVNYDILGAEPPIMALIETDVRVAFPDNFEGAGTGLIVQVHDSLTCEMEGFAWTEMHDGKKVVVCDERTEKRRKILQECMNRTLPGWEIPITAEATVGPVRDVNGQVMLSNWQDA